MAEFVLGIHRFLADDDLIIKIPKYQRGYSWTRDQFKVLWEDICSLLDNTEKTHFMGGVISIKNSNLSDVELEIIDGQQRITTISLFILALIKWARINIMQENTNQAPDVLENEEYEEYFYTILRYIGRNNKGKIRKAKLELKHTPIGQDPLRDDFSEYGHIVEIANNNVEYEKDKSIKSKIRRSFEYFYDKITERYESQNNRCDMHSFFISLVKALQRIMIANIVLEHNKDNPQQVFESMNATGLTLLEADKCRNMMVLGRPKNNSDDTQWQIIWENIEKNTLIGSKSETDLFLQAFLRLYRTKRKPGVGDVKVSKYYEFFKNVIKKCKNDEAITEFYKEIEEYSKYFNNFKVKIVKSYRSAFGIDNSNVTQFLPLLMELTRYYTFNVISEKEFQDALNSIETFIIRKQVCSQKIDIDSCIKKIISELTQLTSDVEKAKIVELVKYYLLHPLGDLSSCAVPDIKSFEDGLRNKELYKTNKTLCRNILVAIEQSMQALGAEVVGISDATIEHIYPQKGYAGDKDAGKKKEWLHKLGNLTLINHNQELSAKSFYDPEEEKKEQEAHSNNQIYERNDKVGCTTLVDNDVKKIGYKYSKLCLNEDLGKMTHWNAEDINKRHESLIKKCLDLWKDITTSYQPPEEGNITEDNLSHDEEEFSVYSSNYEVCGYRFERDEDVVLIEGKYINWTEFRKRCIEYLIENYHESIVLILKEQRFEIISDKKRSGGYKASDHDPNIFIYKPSTGNPGGVLPELRKLILELDRDPTDFVFFVKKKSSK